MSLDDQRIGTTIDGRFRLDRLLGAGGMGKVYAATQLSVGHTVAVKVLRSDISELHASTQRFFREAQVMAALRHPNIVGLIDYGHDEEAGAIFIVMEYVDGRSLTDVLRRGRIPLSLALLICRQVCSGLAQAHAAGIVHRDLKPDNIMLELTAEGRICAKLLDFGIALPQGPDETRFTATGGTLGTPRYMSPEQAQDGAIQAPSDFYALGVILYEMIAGEPPFQADTPLAVLFKTVQERHTPITDVLKGVDLPPGPVASLIDDLLAKNPAERPQDAAELGRQFDRLMADLPAPPIVDDLSSLDRLTQPAVPVPSGGLDAPASTARDAEPNPVVRPKKRSLAPLLALGVFLIGAVVVVAAAAGAIIWASYTSDPPPVAPLATTIAPEPLATAPVVTPPSVPNEPDNPDQLDEPEKVDEPEDEPKKQRGKKKGKKPKKKRPKAKPTKEEYIACQRRTCNVDLKTKGATIVCQADATCDADCLSGGCQQRCMSATCDFECRGGGCKQSCFPGSTCTFSCKGGGCERNILGGDVTELD